MNHPIIIDIGMSLLVVEGVVRGLEGIHRADGYVLTKLE
jgi:hypothetical protein